MSNPILLSQSHSSLVSQLQELQKANPFLNSDRPSHPFCAKEVLQLKPVSTVSKTNNAQTVEFEIPKKGFLLNAVCHLAVNYAVTAGAPATTAITDITPYPGNEFIKSAGIYARGRKIRETTPLARLAQAWKTGQEPFTLQPGTSGQQTYGVPNKSVYDQNVRHLPPAFLGWGFDRKTIAKGANETHDYFCPIISKEVGLPTGKTQINCYDTLMTEQLRVRVELDSLTAPTKFNENGGGTSATYQDCRLIVEFATMDDNNYEKYRAEQFPPDKTLKRLSYTYYNEPVVEDAEHKNNVFPEVFFTVDGLLKTTYVQLTYGSDQLQSNNSDTIAGFEIFSGGRSIYKVDATPSVPAGLHYPEGVDIQRLVNQEPLNLNQATADPSTDYAPRILVINWDDIRMSNHDLLNNTAGGVNASDLPNLSIRITKSLRATPRTKNNIRICHEQYQFEATDSNTGIISVSNRS
jgi:hypothetical protein